LKTGRVFQNINTMIVYNPTDGRNSIVSATVPGFVGSITGMNSHGFTMGVDILRSIAASREHPGLNSIMLIRTVVDNARTTRQAIQLISQSLRGTPWLYPMCDITGVI
jgi:predicted choloylglycine hydrolase